MKKKILLIAPINTSAFSICMLLDLLKLGDIEVCGVIVKKITYQRFLQEWKRDGSRLLKKAFTKLVLKEKNLNFISQIPTAKDRILRSTYKTYSLKGICLKNKINYCQVSDLNGVDSIDFLKILQPDICLFTGGGILRNEFLKNTGSGVLNCHIGILPDFKGMDVVEWPFLINPINPKLGMTVHFMDNGVDTGPIIQSIPLYYNGCFNIQQIRITLEGLKIDLLNNVILDFLNDSLIIKEQNGYEGKQYYVMHDRLLTIAKKRAKIFLK